MTKGETYLRVMDDSDVSEVVELADQTVGTGYYDAPAARKTLLRSTQGDRCFSYVARRRADGALLGFRFTLPPQRWDTGRGAALHEAQWPFALGDAAYFQSCVVRVDSRGRGIGQSLARRALIDLECLGAKGVVAHSWAQSPGQSSLRYLERLGFSVVARCPDYWLEVDYNCPRCGTQCRCTAYEMVLKLDSR